MNHRKKFPAVMETVFDIGYLCTGVVIGVVLLTGAANRQQNLYGIMALVLVFGDSFHLIPRIKTALTGEKEKFLRPLGAGKMITSITMTVFYVLLWHIGLLHYALSSMAVWTVVVYLLAAARIVLCLCPQNRWLTGDGSPRWNTYRNLPFLLLGGMVLLLFAGNASVGDPFRWMWLAILLSFTFYVPVVWGAQHHPMLGMLMLPKSCVYLWILCLGLNL